MRNKAFCEEKLKAPMFFGGEALERFRHIISHDLLGIGNPKKRLSFKDRLANAPGEENVIGPMLPRREFCGRGE